MAKAKGIDKYIKKFSTKDNEISPMKLSITAILTFSNVFRSQYKTRLPKLVLVLPEEPVFYIAHNSHIDFY